MNQAIKYQCLVLGYQGYDRLVADVEALSQRFREGESLGGPL